MPWSMTQIESPSRISRGILGVMFTWIIRPGVQGVIT
jgi:hypothetical protein